jgi:hypothetical protein
MARAVRTVLVVIACLGGLSTCASRTREGGTPRTDSRILTYAEIQDAAQQNIGNLYDLISTRRSQWLRSRSGVPTRGAATEYTVSVWMDGIRLGGQEQLRLVPLSTIVEVRYLTPSEAQASLGLNNLGGAIAISTRR